jgi:hypothetical protein
MNLFVWISLYFLVGAFGWGIKFRSSSASNDDWAFLLPLVIGWPVFVGMWILLLPFRAGQWIGRRWPGR